MKANNFKHTCIRLRKRGYALGEIVKITGRPKTSVYFHIKSIELSETVKRAIKKQWAIRIKTFNKARKGKSNFNRHPHQFINWTGNIVSLVAHLLFDGELRHSGCFYTNQNKVLLDKVENLMRKVYDYPPQRSEPTPSVYRTSYYNVELSAYIKEKTKELLFCIPTMPKELKRSFLRTFFDDEGSVYFIGNKRLVRGYQHSSEILNIIHSLLNDFGVTSKIDEKYHEIVISGRENLKRFRAEINFSPSVSINPNRKNSVWKRPLEKREILQMALNSYQ